MTKETMRFGIATCKLNVQASISVDSKSGLRQVGCTSLGDNGHCLIDTDKCTHLFPQSSEIKPIFVNGEKLVNNEAKLFRLLLERCGEVVTIDEIIDATGYREDSAYVLVGRLRRKITQDRPEDLHRTIENVKEHGYRLASLEGLKITD